MSTLIRASLVLAVVGLAAVAVGRTRTECRADVKQFSRACDQSCDSLKKKNQRAADHCRKMCREQAAKFEKECDDGK